VLTFKRGWPTALYCYMVGKNATSPHALGLKMRRHAQSAEHDDDLEEIEAQEERA